MILSQFFEENIESAKQLYDKIFNIMNQVSLFAPEDLVTIYIVGGLLMENTAFVEAEERYVIALLLLQKIYGDPRGRGCRGHAIQLFLCWRLSILCRLQNKIEDAEYVEELFDVITMTLTPNILSNRYKEYAEQGEKTFIGLSNNDNQTNNHGYQLNQMNNLFSINTPSKNSSQINSNDKKVENITAPT